MSWGELVGIVPHLKNLKDAMKYIPVRASERMTQGSLIYFKEWANRYDFNEKKDYIAAKQSKRALFSDISNDIFLSKAIHKFDKIAEWISRNPGMFSDNVDAMESLLSSIENWKPQYQKSILMNLHNVDLDLLYKDSIPWEAKTALVKHDKMEEEDDEAINKIVYLWGKNDDAIITLNTGQDSSFTILSIVTDEDHYPNVKINKNTEKYLYPIADQLSLNVIRQLTANYNLSDKMMSDALRKVGDDQTKFVKKIKGTDYLFDKNTLHIYQSKGNKLEDVSKDFNKLASAFIKQIKSDEEFQKKFIDQIGNLKKFNAIDGGIIHSLVQAIPKGKLGNIVIKGTPMDIISVDSTEADGQSNIVLVPKTLDNNPNFHQYEYGDQIINKKMDYLLLSIQKKYVNYRKSTKTPFSSEEFDGMLNWTRHGRTGRILQNLMDLVEDGLPLADDINYIPKVRDGELLLIHKTGGQNLTISPKSGKLVKSNVRAKLDDEGNIIVSRRGRPAGMRNRDVAAAVPQLGPEEGERVSEWLAEFGIRNAPNDDRAMRTLYASRGVEGDIRNDRGVTRRNNIIDYEGRVVHVFRVGPSRIYVLELGNTRVANVVYHPGNRHYLITDQNIIRMDGPDDLLQTLRNQNIIVEVVKKYTLEEFYINEKYLSA